MTKQDAPARQVITKLEAACRQLELAIRLYFDQGDIVAIHTLACASREIFEKHCKLDNRYRLFERFQLNHPEATEKELWEIINRARNFFKHADPEGNLNSSVELGDADNKVTIFMAAHDCTSLLGDAAPAVFQRYVCWFVATMPGYRQHLPELDEKFPGLHEASEKVQRYTGKLIILPNPSSAGT